MGIAGCRSNLVASCRHGNQSSRVVLPHSKSNPKFDWSFLWKIVKPDLVLLVLAVGSAIVVSFLNVMLPLTLGELINVISNLKPGQPLAHYITDLLQPGLKLAGIYAVNSLFTFSYIGLLSIVGERCAVRLRTELFQSLIHQDIAFFDVHKTGELVNRLSGDVQDFKSSFKMVISQGLKSITQSFGCMISLVLISPQMTGMVGVVIPVMVAVGTIMGGVLRRWSREAQNQVAMATSVANEALGNIRTVRAFAMEDKELSLYQQEINLSSWFNQKLGLGIAGFQGLANLAINGVVLLVISHGGLLLATNQITPGSLMSFLMATQTIQRSLGNLSVLFGQVVRGMTAGARVFEYINLSHSIPISVGGVVPNHMLTGRIEFSNVTFSYPSRSDQIVLNDFSLTIPSGQVTALCGQSGAGKSTVAALLERFYDVNVGCVSIDGHDIRDLNPRWLRGSLIGYINQEPVLFATDVMENIRYGRPTATDDEVYEAAKFANADGFIKDFPSGYKTLVGERGVTLSGGQKQRIAIARALLKDPHILLLDEATSALDAQSERLVQEALDRVSKGRTVLVIAHRLSTIQDADNIAVLQNGRLVESGNHKTLMMRRGLYYDLVKRQTELD
jgi:ATP-binding cassette subfamily B (MDR/TAP) protein 8